MCELLDSESSADLENGGDAAQAGQPDRAPVATAFEPGKDHGRKFRRSMPISAYVGSNGSGKTLCMVHDVLPSLFSGRDIYTTCPLHLPDGTVPPNVHILTSWRQILDAEHADILLDEVSAICSSRDIQALPPQVATILQQLRKRDLTLRWTAPSWSRADRMLRETTQLMTVCHGWISRKDPTNSWRRHVFFNWTSYDAGDYADFTDAAHVSRRLKPLKRAFYAIGPHAVAPACYDSWAQVSTIGTVLDSGRCAVCGGRRTVPECTCPDYVSRRHKR